MHLHDTPRIWLILGETSSPVTKRFTGKPPSNLKNNVKEKSSDFLYFIEKILFSYRFPDFS